MSQIYYLDLRTNRIKTTLHCKFDKGMNDLPFDAPNAKQLCRSMNAAEFPSDTEYISTPNELDLQVLKACEQVLPHPSDMFTAYAYVDASHATCLCTQRSTGIHVQCLGVTAISYKAKLQPTVATSSTEAEFIAAVSCAKELKHVWHVLTQLGEPQLGP